MKTLFKTLALITLAVANSCETIDEPSLFPEGEDSSYLMKEITPRGTGLFRSTVPKQGIFTTTCSAKQTSGHLEIFPHAWQFTAIRAS